METKDTSFLTSLSKYKNKYLLKKTNVTAQKLQECAESNGWKLVDSYFIEKTRRTIDKWVKDDEPKYALGIAMIATYCEFDFKAYVESSCPRVAFMTVSLSSDARLEQMTRVLMKLALEVKEDAPL
jgi:hypothetical protein